MLRQIRTCRVAYRLIDIAARKPLHRRRGRLKSLLQRAARAEWCHHRVVCLLRYLIGARIQLIFTRLPAMRPGDICRLAADFFYQLCLLLAT
ncbi:hypothetical protein AAH446_06025 [Erwinia sp. P6884]|uniref:hypothetical protein n=1 Tax=Erwinia sp. P6884 TaxID=3141450 RepID=UPI003189EDEF